MEIVRDDREDYDDDRRDENREQGVKHQVP